MNESRSHAALRAARDTALVVAVALVFVLAWAVPSLSDGARRLTSFGACLLFVVFFPEAERSWRRFHSDRA